MFGQILPISFPRVWTASFWSCPTFVWLSSIPDQKYIFGVKNKAHLSTVLRFLILVFKVTRNAWSGLNSRFRCLWGFLKKNWPGKSLERWIGFRFAKKRASGLSSCLNKKITRTFQKLLTRSNPPDWKFCNFRGLEFRDQCLWTT